MFIRILFVFLCLVDQNCYSHPTLADNSCLLLLQKFVSGKTTYPRGVFFIVGNEFCERFSYYGMRGDNYSSSCPGICFSQPHQWALIYLAAILVIYLIDWLGFDHDRATAIYHFFIVLCYFSPTVGAVLADGFIGKYRWFALLILELKFIIASQQRATVSFHT